MKLIKRNGKFLIDSVPLEASIGNMVRRILKIIREEYISELKNRTEETDPQESLHKILTAEGDQENDYSHSVPTLKSALLEHITEFEVELETWSVSEPETRFTWIKLIFYSTILITVLKTSPNKLRNIFIPTK